MTKYLSAALETGAYGSGAGTKSGIKVTSINKTVNRNEMIEETTDNPIVNHAAVGAFGVSGSLECLFRPTQIAPLIQGLFGDATSPYVLGEPLPLVFGIGESYGATAYEQAVAGVGITSGTFTFEAKEFVKCSFDFIGRSIADSGSYVLPTYVADEPMTFYKAALYHTSVGVGNLIGYTKSMELTIDRKLADDQFFLGSYLLDYLVPTGAADVTGSMTFGERQISEIRRAIYGGTAATSLVDNASNVFVIVVEMKNLAGATKATFSLAASLYTEASDSQTGKAEAEKTVNFRVTDTSAGAAGLTLTLA